MALTETIHPDVVLSAAQDAKLRSVIVIGIDANGKPYRAASEGNAETIIDMLEEATEHIEMIAEPA